MFLFIALISSIAGLQADTCSIDNSKKVDCGYVGIDQSTCEAKSCCWAEANDGGSTPWCFQKAMSTGGYQLSSMSETSTGLRGTLTQQSGSGSSMYGADLPSLTFEILFESAEYAHFKIYDSEHARWEVPQSVVSRPQGVAKLNTETLNYVVTYNADPFSITVVRRSDGVAIFKSDASLYFKDQYIEFTHKYNPEATTYGIGESARLNQALSTNNAIYTLWAGDTPSLLRDINLYSSFPMYIQMLNGQASGGMMMNSNGMDVVLNADTLTYKMTGGIIDFYVFNGPTPADTIAQYTAIVGKPTMMPYWSLGFHNCKYGYTSIQQVEDVVAGYAAAGIPLDTQWVDIDYMQNYRDFTTDSVNFPTAEVNRFVGELHSKGQQFVAIVDPGIMIQAGYDAYEEGLKEGVFIKDITGQPYLGQVWPGPTYFPDFMHPKSTSYWTKQLQTFYDMVPLDGVWIDMNEPSNFCNDNGRAQTCVNSAPSGCPAPGASQTDCCLVCTEVDPNNKYEHPPYAIHNSKGALSTKTVAVSGTQYGNASVYDTHNLYGITEQMATNAAMSEIRNKRPFLLSRSAFLGSGGHSAKWTGDNAATWADLQSSIVSILDFSLFAVPMVGADICGFISDTTEELCARWIEVGAFYPFSRNHNALGQKPQELYLWDSVATASRKYLGMRYQLLSYMYTLHHAAHVTGGATVATALWMNYPSDPVTLKINTQFMLGKSVLISPVVTEGATAVSAYFPAGYWYNMETLALDHDTTQGGAWISIDTPLTSTNVHITGGSIIPMQQAALTTSASRQSAFTLVVAVCPGGKAFGSLYWDNGEEIKHQNYLTVAYAGEFTGKDALITGAVTAVGDIAQFSNIHITKIVVTSAANQVSVPLAVAEITSKITAHGKAVGDAASTSSVVSGVHNAANVLTLNVDIPITSDFAILW